MECAAPRAGTPARRRWYQFSLRTLLVVMVVVSTAAGLLGIRLQRARRQGAAVVSIRRIDGSVTYAESDSAFWLVRDPLEPWLGRDFFDSVVEAQVDLRQADTTAGQLAVWRTISDLPQLARLEVDYPKRYPRSRFNIGPIRRLSKLKHLKIRDAQIQGDDLLPLEKMPVLETLDLSHCQISDTAWRHLAAVPHLHTLRASYAFVNDSGAAQLAACRDLRHLNLTRATVTDRGAAELAKIAPLETLVLDGTRITDAGLAHLSRLENLQSLSICETSVTDQGLECLTASANMKKLEAERTNVTAAGLREFQNSRPHD